MDAGYDMLLTANNHAGDTMASGITRTVEIIRGKGLTALGSQLNADEPKYAVVDVNGIKIGMVCYTWAYSSNGSSFSLNGLTPIKDEGQMNYFLNNDPGKLYTASEQILEQMKADGAEATIMFIHWGVEYNIKENSLQDTMAQKLCDLGIDVIVGGHPHVVQPVDLLTSTVDPDHKTVIIYSLGNAVSNQRNGYIQAAPPYYTEDGILFTVTFEKYSDGAVYLQSVDALPTWVNMRTDGAKQYNILPLDEDLPVFGGKTLRVKTGVAFRYADGRPSVTLRGVMVMGLPLPNAWLGGLKNVDLVQEFGADEGFWKAFADGVESLRVEDGLVAIRLKE